MKAIVRNSTTPGDMSLHELEIPKPNESYLLAKVAYAGICASDLDILYNRNDIYRPPVVQGHEFSAYVEEVGADVKGFAKGDLITSETTFAIEGVHDAHILPDYQLMPGKHILGWTVHGGFAEYILLNSHFCHKFSSKTNPQIAALCEPAAIAAESVIIKGEVQSQDVVVVIGPGPIGLLCAFIAKEYVAAKQVYLIGLPSDVPCRLATARQMGLENCFSIDEPIIDIIKNNNAGNLADVIIDATGHIKGFELSLDLVKRNGRIVEAGSITGDTHFSWERAAYLALTLSFVFSSSRNAWKIATDFINNTALNLEQLISKVHSLHHFEQAFSDAQHTKENIKVLFQPNLKQ